MPSVPHPMPELAAQVAAADQVTDRRLRELAAVSHRVIAEHQQPGGAYPASPTFSAYRGYAWLRDGAFTAEGMSRYGDVASADAFHDWVQRTLVARTAQVADLVACERAGDRPQISQLLPTRFTFDGADGSDPWWDFQTDGYGIWLWAVATHAERHRLDLGRWAPAVRVATDYLTAFGSWACYDWWEEHVEQRHVSTLAACWAGLRAAVGSGLLDPARERAAGRAADDLHRTLLTEGVGAAPGEAPHLVKWVGSTAVDASLTACVVPFGLLPVGDPLAGATLDAVRRDLLVDGGVHRFAADVFYGGGQWLLLTCLLGWNEAAAGDRDAALDRLRWVAAHATADDELPEQVPDHLLAPDHRQEWLDRWGPVAAPLLWSHGMYLILADELGLLPREDQR